MIATMEAGVAEGLVRDGIHEGELMGMPPSGKRIAFTGITISRCEGGRIAEESEITDTVALLGQVGALPTLARAEDTGEHGVDRPSLTHRAYGDEPVAVLTVTVTQCIVPTGQLWEEPATAERGSSRALWRSGTSAATPTSV
jgi:hypothetical protein